MNRTTDTINIAKVGQIPTLETIRAIPRERTLKLVFEKGIQDQRETFGKNLINELSGFQVGIHTIDPEINISKLITDKEIDDNQNFFEQCAKDYRLLGEELLFKLVDKLGLKLNKDFPMETFNQLKRDKRSTGKVGDWRYFVHGFHCGFENNKTGQLIEVPLVFGLEFGDLDPYFFSKFIKSTPYYRPLPVDIFEDYADGVRINERMISLGKFERISSNVGNHYGIVVTDRPKVEIKSHLDLEKMYKDQNKQIRKSDLLTLDKNKLFRRINVGLLVCLALFILFDKEFLGAGIVLTLMGILSMIAFIYNTEPLGLSIGGFDYAMRSLLKEYYNRYFNLFWGLIELALGLGFLIKIFN